MELFKNQVGNIALDLGKIAENILSVELILAKTFASDEDIVKATKKLKNQGLRIQLNPLINSTEN